MSRRKKGWFNWLKYNNTKYKIANVPRLYITTPMMKMIMQKTMRMTQPAPKPSSVA